MGVLYQRCRTTPAPLLDPSGKNKYLPWEPAEGVERLCSFEGRGSFTCPTGTYCGKVIDYPELDFSTEETENQEYIMYGKINFDHLLRAIITIFQMITLEGWTTIMYNLGDAS